MPKYIVQKDFKGSPDGHTVIQFVKGEEVAHAKLGDDLAKVALDEKWIKKAVVKATKADQEQKLVGEEAYRAALDGGATEELAEAARAQAIAEFLA